MPSSSRPLSVPHPASLALAVACVALLVAGCSVDSKGFGGSDGGLGGSASATGGANAGGGPGSGGVSASGGTPGSGGAPSSGGHTGSGGKSGTGGAGSGGKGSGGTTATGGTAAGGAGGGLAGAGGGGGKSPGSGGVGGKGGMGGGTSQGGQGGAPSKSCDELVSEYATALDQARACDPSAAGQCQQTASSTLSYCNTCPEIPVNDASRLTTIRAQWLAQGCATPTVCPAIACVLPSPGTCTATGAAAPGGRCESSGIVSN